jgi:hypothetical protein
MNIPEKVFTSKEKRLDYERRQFSFSLHIPERRTGKDRRREIRYENTPDFMKRHFKPVLVQQPG